MEPTLYIIMRTDIPDMNPGKAAAQAAHAQADFDEWRRSEELDRMTHHQLLAWAQDRTFGRTLVVTATRKEIDELTPYTVIDPTYPWKNWYGETFTSAMLTCGWLFVHGNTFDENSRIISERIQALPLMP